MEHIAHLHTLLKATPIPPSLTFSPPSMTMCIPSDVILAVTLTLSEGFLSLNLYSTGRVNNTYLYILTKHANFMKCVNILCNS